VGNLPTHVFLLRTFPGFCCYIAQKISPFFNFFSAFLVFPPNAGFSDRKFFSLFPMARAVFLRRRLPRGGKKRRPAGEKQCGVQPKAGRRAV
jgi:hypothetical protein